MPVVGENAGKPDLSSQIYSAHDPGLRRPAVDGRRRRVTPVAVRRWRWPRSTLATTSSPIGSVTGTVRDGYWAIDTALSADVQASELDWQQTSRVLSSVLAHQRAKCCSYSGTPVFWKSNDGRYKTLI